MYSTVKNITYLVTEEIRKLLGTNNYNYCKNAKRNSNFYNSYCVPYIPRTHVEFESYIRMLRRFQLLLNPMS